MKILRVPFIFFACLTVLNSCDKSSNDDNTTKTNTQMLTASAWVYDNAKIDADNNGTGDTQIPAGVLQPCQTDNILTFTTSGTGTIDEGAVKCNTTDPQSTPFTWSFASNETVLNFSAPIFAGVGGDFKVITVSDTQLALSKATTLIPSPTPVTVIVYFKH